jgi:dipeptidyl aminopeptidase/acylaminoacyl peptidase
VSARVQAVVDFYGPTDLAAVYQQYPRVRGYLTSFLGGPPSRIPGRYAAASPLFHVTPDDPPVFITQGTADRAVPYTQSIALDNALKAAGIREELVLFYGVPHGFQFQVGGGDLAPRIAQFLDSVLNGPTPAT